jgi:hypothetical protein
VPPDLALEDVLCYALGAPIPRAFALRLRERRRAWDPEFRQRLDALAYELRPDLAVWEIEAAPDGRLAEHRLPMLPE